VRRFAVTGIAISLLLNTFGCGGTSFLISPSNGTIFFTSGTVTFVQVGIVNGNQVTMVTMTNAENAQTFNFCGDLVSQFPMNSFVTASYKQGNGCEIVVQIAS